MVPKHIFFVILWFGHSLADSRPHIIFIIADDLGWNDVSFHGSDQIPTPNIDVLANDGIILNRYYVQPFCSPSRGALLTGKYPTRLGLQHYTITTASPWGLPLNEKTLPQYMKDMGYATHGIGKWHLGMYTKNYLPTNRGFDSFFGFWLGEGDYCTHLSKPRSLSYVGLDLHDGEEGAWEYNGIYSTELFTSKAKTIIENHNASEPLFLYIGYQAVHTGLISDPLQAPERYVAQFSCIDDPDRRIFAGVVNALDEAIGDIISSLDESNMLDNTLLVFSTDNGGAVEGQQGATGSNWPLRGCKSTLWEGGIRGTAFVWSSELRKNSRADNNFFHISDWLPTLYTVAGGDSNELIDIDGFDQWPTINEGWATKREEILHNIDEIWEVASIRRGPYKLVSGSHDEALDGWFDQQGKAENNTSFRETCNWNREEYLRESQVMRILAKRFGKEIDDSSDSDLRLLVDCGPKPENFTTDCKPKEKACLFDIEQDPCEYNNIAESHPQIVSKLEALLEKHSESSIPPGNKPVDPSADPMYHGNVWVPWIESGE